jgi:putative pyruvate formate lyase activating enzyme
MGGDDHRSSLCRPSAESFVYRRKKSSSAPGERPRRHGRVTAGVVHALLDSTGVPRGAGARHMGCSRERSARYAAVDAGVEPAYMTLFRSGALAARAREATARLASCDLCARYCRVDRFAGVKGAVCRTGHRALVHSFGPHYGEERPLSGTCGSGTIFFTWCNLRCVFCQNAQIAQLGEGREVSAEQLADMMLQLQRRGCHNINLVTPSHVVAQILEALVLAAADGLRLPLVYNSGGYDSAESLALLDGVIDIYLPDMKYGDSGIARRHSKVPDYVEVNQAAVREMYRQVGELTLDEHGIARRGLLVRHLVLPGGLAGTEQVLEFLRRDVSPTISVNVMGQYQPYFKASQYPPLDRLPTVEELQRAAEAARRSGLHLVTAS